MNIVPEIIKPITLLSGSHHNTATTGQGCFMNVIAYLNGEPQITDKSPCVCVTVRPIVIWLNDFMSASERHQLLPFICRAMGSATENNAEIARRLVHVVDFANTCAKSAAESAAEAAAEAVKYAVKHARYATECAAEHAARYAAKSAAKSAAERAAERAAQCAAEHASYAAEHASYAAEHARYAAESASYAASRQPLINAGLAFLDAALPPLPDAAPAQFEADLRAIIGTKALALAGI